MAKQKLKNCVLKKFYNVSVIYCIRNLFKG